MNHAFTWCYDLPESHAWACSCSFEHWGCYMRFRTKKNAKTYMNQTVALCFEFTYLVVAFYFWYLQVTYGTCWTYRTCKLDLAHLQDNFPNYEHNLPKLDLATSQRYSKWKSIFPITQYHLFLLFSFLVKQKTSKNNDKSMLFWMFLKIDCFWHGDKNMWKL